MSIAAPSSAISRPGMPRRSAPPRPRRSVVDSGPAGGADQRSGRQLHGARHCLPRCGLDRDGGVRGRRDLNSDQSISRASSSPAWRGMVIALFVGYSVPSIQKPNQDPPPNARPSRANLGHRVHSTVGRPAESMATPGAPSCPNPGAALPSTRHSGPTFAVAPASSLQRGAGKGSMQHIAPLQREPDLLPLALMSVCV